MQKKVLLTEQVVEILPTCSKYLEGLVIPQQKPCVSCI